MGLASANSFNPKQIFTIPSGIVTITPETIALFAETIPQLGFLTSKTISIEPRNGYDEPVLCTYDTGLKFRNAVGLANPGMKYWKNEMNRFLPLPNHKILLTSIMGGNEKQFAQVSAYLHNVTDAFELNLSCPHVSDVGTEVGSSPDSAARMIKAVKENTNHPIFAKLSPNLQENLFCEIVQACIEAGAYGLTLINTLGPFETSDPINNQLILSHKKGGTSGIDLLEILKDRIKLTRKVTKSPIIAMGGISQSDDIKELINLGANYMGIGSALWGMTTQNIRQYFQRLQENLLHDKTSANMEFPSVNMQYGRFTVVKNKNVGRDLFYISCKEKIANINPGQIVFTWLPDKKEKPMSLANCQPVELLIRIVGDHTQALSQLKTGEYLYLRGGYGNGFPHGPNQIKPWLIGGGTGAAPLLHYARKNPIHKLYIGCSRPEDAWIPEDLNTRLKAKGTDIKFVIDRPDEPGRVVDTFIDEYRQKYKGTKLDLIPSVFICGPEKMERAIIEKMEKIGFLGKCYFSVETYMKCGVGICGICSIEDGRRSCVDGPCFNDLRLDNWRFFGEYKRQKDGSLINC